MYSSSSFRTSSRVVEDFAASMSGVGLWGDLARVWLLARSSCAVQFGRHLGALVGLELSNSGVAVTSCRRHGALGWLGASLRRKE